MKKGTSLIRLCIFACVALMLALLVMHLLPFWTVGEEQFSIQQYTWFTWNCEALTDHIVDNVDPEFMVKDMALIPFVVLFGSVLGTIFCLLNAKKPGFATIPLAIGIIGAVGYLTNPVFQMGAQWHVHLALCVLMALVALVPLSTCVNAAIKWFEVPKEA